MNFKLPTIESKNKINEEEEYNFVNKDKKKPQSKDSSSLQFVDELKKKIEEQKRQIETRNNTIMAIQRNFESMSVILKNEKIQNATVKQELDRIKKSTDQTNKRAAQYHEKCLVLSAQIKRIKEQMSALQEQKKLFKKNLQTMENYKRIIAELETNLNNLSNRVVELEADKKTLQNEVAKFKAADKQRRALSEKIIDLEQELSKSENRNTALSLEIKRLQDQVQKLKERELKNEQANQELKRKQKEFKSKDQSSLDELRNYKTKISELEAQNKKFKESLDNKELIIQMRNKQDEETKQLVSELSKKNEKLVRSNKELDQECNSLNQIIEKTKSILTEKDQMLVLNNNEIGSLTKKLQLSENDLKNLKKTLEQINQQHSSLNNKAMGDSQKLNISIREISILKNDKLSLESHLASLQKDLKQKETIVNAYRPYFQEIQKNKPHVKILKQEQFDKYIKLVADYEAQEKSLRELVKSQKQKIQLEKRDRFNLERSKDQMAQQLERERLEKERTKEMLKKYQNEEEQLKSIIQEEKDLLKRLENEKIQKEMEIEKQRNNNKLLWNDNKKLKEKEKLLEQLQIEKNELERAKQQQLNILEAKKQLELKDLQKKKQEDIQKTKNELKSKYESELSILKQSISTNGQLSSILLQKTNQIQTLQQQIEKINGQLEFYKNRNKELEGVVSRTQKRFREAENTYRQQNQRILKESEKLKNENKSLNQMLPTLMDKVNAIDKERKNFEAVANQNKKLAMDISKYIKQNTELKDKLARIDFNDLQNKKKSIEQKVKLLKKSMGDLDQAITAVHNHLCCNHCVELPVQPIRLVPCGHIYCKKCKAGYDPNCSQCKKKGEAYPDKHSQQTISKLKYMEMILLAVKDQTEILSKF